MKSVSHVLPAYIALIFHVSTSNALETTWKHSDLTVLPGKGHVQALTISLSFVISAVFYGLGRATVRTFIYIYSQSLNLLMQSMIPESIILPYSSYYPIPFIAVSTLYLFPKASRSISSLIAPWQIFLLSLLSTTAFSMLFGYLAFHQQFSFIDPIVACLLLYGTIFSLKLNFPLNLGLS